MPEGIVNEIKTYLGPHTYYEEGGMLLGIRTWNEDKLTVEVKEFVPIKSNFKAYGIDYESLLENSLPGEEIGYYADPDLQYQVLQRTKTYDQDAELMWVGFVHNHPRKGWTPNPSLYDLHLTNKTFGYIMAIYANSTNELKIWYTQNKGKEQWQETTKPSSSLAAVELAATL